MTATAKEAMKTEKRARRWRAEQRPPLDQSGVMALASAIVMQAADDYKAGLIHQHKVKTGRIVTTDPVKRDKGAVAVRECRRFIESGWFSTLTMDSIDPQKFMQSIRSSIFDEFEEG